NRRCRLDWPALMGILAWSGLALTGAAVADDPAPQDDGDAAVVASADGKVVILQEQDGEGGKTLTVRVIGEDGTVLDEDVDSTAYFTAREGDKGTAKCVVITKGGDLHTTQAPVGAGPCGSLAHYMKMPEIPVIADVDDDGKVSWTERAAYLTALALADPEAVLAEFQSADTDGNDTLSLDEAVALVTAPIRIEVVKEVATKSDEEDADVKVELQIGDGEDAEQLVWHGKSESEVILPRTPAGWLMQNISADLTTEDVAEYIDAVGEMPPSNVRCKKLRHTIHMEEGESFDLHKDMKIMISEGEGVEPDMIDLETLGDDEHSIIILRTTDSGEATIDIVVDEDEEDTP
ncbi:MAG: hypothetical protein JSU68_11210, partial [Phycisphaerales bacterium]